MTKTWLITGSSRGFGRELAKAVLDNEDRLVATARRPEQLDDLGGEYGAIRGAGFGGSRRRSAEVGCGEQVGRLRRARGRRRTGQDPCRLLIHVATSSTDAGRGRSAPAPTPTGATSPAR
jgi:NAD(P)-dependent dehydrogenase (short-subunit alcohol dehydrogenase family)